MVDQLCTSYKFAKYFYSTLVYTYNIRILIAQYLLMWLLQRFETPTEVKGDVENTLL